MIKALPHSGLKKLLSSFSLSLALILSAGILAPHQVQADETKNVKIATKGLNFLVPKPSGSLMAAIVYDAGSASSKAHAEALAAAIGSGLNAGKVTLSAKLVPSSDLSGLAGAGIVFVANDASAQHAAIFSETSSRKLLSVSFDDSCVQAGNCVMGVATTPKIEITVSQAARNASGVNFSSAFLMMIKEI